MAVTSKFICFISIVFIFVSTVSADFELFKKAVGSVLDDKGFEIATQKAERAVLTAERLLKWVECNKVEGAAFASTLVTSIRMCCSHSRAVLCHTLKEKMWEKYYKLCSSEDFRTSWTQFIQSSIGFLGNPIYYQFVTKAILEEIIKIQFPVIHSYSPNATEQVSLDFQERNALRYVGGYLLRSLKTKISKSANPLKESILLCLEDLFEAGKG